MKDVRIQRLGCAILEAERFIDKAKEMLDAYDGGCSSYGSKYMASAKRSSMDLTRSLAVFRSSPYE